MIKLADILKEVSLEEKVIQVPQEVLDKSKSLYDYINKIKDKVTKKGTIQYSTPYIDPKLKNYFQLKDLKGVDLNVTVGIYNDAEDAGAGRMDTTDDVLLVNIAVLGDLEEFEDLVEHELVHAMDPKVRDVKIFGKMYAKKGAEPDQFEKYVKAPWEFDAFTAPLVNKLKASINKTGNQKPTYTKLLIKMLSDLKTQDADTILQNEEYAPLAWLFTKSEWNEENWGQAWNTYSNEIPKMKAWTTKPTLYKRFLQRVAAGIH